MRSLTAIRSRADRVRSQATVAAATGIGVALLIVGVVATIQDDVLTGSSISWSNPDGTIVTEQVREPVGELAPFLAQPGLRPGVIVAAILLVLPFLALAVQALRVGKIVEDRRSRQLLTAGATWHDLRRLKVARTTAAFVRGALLTAPVYLLLWLILGVALPAGSRLLPPLSWPVPLLWLATFGVLWLLGRGLAAVTVRADHTHALRKAGLVPVAPSRTLVLLFAVAGVAVVCTTPVVGAVPALFPIVIVVAVVLLLVAAGAASARSAVLSETRARSGGNGRPFAGRAAEDAQLEKPGRRAAPRPLRGRDLAVSVLADAQRRGSAAAVTGTAGVLFVCGLSFGVESALVAQLLTPQGAESGYTRDDLAFYIGGAALAGALGVVAVVVAITALLLSLTDHLLGNRRAVASTAALGTETRRLVAVQARCLTRTAVPVTVAGVLLSALPYSLLFVVNWADGWSWVGLLPLAVALVAGVLIAVLCRMLAVLLTGRVRAAAALENLRVA